MANNPNLHGVELNRAINRTYVGLAGQIQKALDPSFGQTSAVAPSWYAMAIYASRGAGRGMLSAEQALNLIGASKQPLQAVRRAFPDVPEADWERYSPGNDVPSEENSQATAFLLALHLGQQDRPQRINLDPRALAISAGRLAWLLIQPGVTLGGVVGTLLNMLEDGNRRIFHDIGVAGQRFLELRRDHPQISPEQMLGHFTDQPQLADQAYQDGLAWAHGTRPLPTDFGTLYSFPSQHLLAAAMGLYQKASQAGERGLRDRIIAHADNLMAYHEQATVAVPAFLPGQVLVGETDRARVMQILTPQVDVKTRHWSWEYSRFPMEDLDGSAWTPPCCERNWARFEDRWPPILDYFERCYQQPESLWPMPCPDPAQPVDAGDLD